MSNSKCKMDSVLLETPLVPYTGDLRELALKAKHFALRFGPIQGAKVKPEDEEAATFFNLMLFPSPFPKLQFEFGKRVQLIINKLMLNVSVDHAFLESCLRSTIEVDDFTRNIWDIYETVKNEGTLKEVTFSITRSDYMLHVHSNDQDEETNLSLRQVEINTMSVGAAYHTNSISALHRYILEEIDEEDNLRYLPENQGSPGFGTAFVVTWKQYDNDKAVILFIIDPCDYNVYDQREVEYNIRKLEKIKIIRRTLGDIRERGILTSDRRFVIDGYEVAVVYQRFGYRPEHFQGKEDWDARLMMERSRAIMCPSAGFHLAGTKKVQQVLSSPGVLERFISDPAELSMVNETLSKLYSLDMGEEGNKSVELAMKSPDKFVLKPQREGGGNNIYGDDIRKVLSRIGNTTERAAYVLMEKLNPAPFVNYAVHYGKEVGANIYGSEIGFYGAIVTGKDGEIIMNNNEGFLYRTKRVEDNEGSIAREGGLDSPYFV